MTPWWANHLANHLANPPANHLANHLAKITPVILQGS